MWFQSYVNPPSRVVDDDAGVREQSHTLIPFLVDESAKSRSS